jgi:predicted transcriptional regulator
MAKQKKGSDTFTIRVPDELRDQMLQVCQEEQLTPSHLIRECIAICLDLRAGNKKRKEKKIV